MPRTYAMFGSLEGDKRRVGDVGGRRGIWSLLPLI
jgi:hypothetical protein